MTKTQDFNQERVYPLTQGVNGDYNKHEYIKQKKEEKKGIKE